MLRNYIKIAWRNFSRNKFYSLINVLGLSIGLACLIIIMLFVTDELSYDSFHDQSEQIHLVATESKFGKKLSRSLSTPYPLGLTMKEEIPEVEHYLVTMWPGQGQVNRDGEEPVTEDDIMMSTKDFFEVFSFPLVAGNPETVLDDPNSVVLTEKMAQKYFPKENALGKTIRIQRYGDHEYTVTGIAKNMDHNSYVSFDFVMSILGTSPVQSNRDSWNASMFHTFVKLRDDADWKKLEHKLASIVDTQIGDEHETMFFSIPVSQLYISEHVTVSGFKGNMKYIYIFSAIAFFILLLACINYMNLATARATQRSREVEIRKVVGAYRGQLIRQFIGEALLTTLMAFIVGLIFAELALPFFNEFVGKELALSIFNNSLYMASLLGVALFVGLISGSYPAFFLSKYDPAGVLKGEAHKLFAGVALRKILVVTQFAVSTILIISTLIVYNQLDYVLQKNLGFDDEKVMYIPAYQIQDEIETFKQQVNQHSAVLEASAASSIPGSFGLRISQQFDPGNPENEFSAHLLRSDADYKDVLGLKMIAGRYFDEDKPTDRDTARVINEAMLKELDWGSPEDAVGKSLNNGKKIIGVVKDFHFQSLHHTIGPVLIQMKPSNASRYNNYDLLALRFNTGQVDNLINYLQEEWKKLNPATPMSYYFLDEKFAEQYETDQKLSQAFSAFTGIAIFIASIGLLGLAAFSTERRTKEIGIRKVLGATVANIVGLLSKDFLMLVSVGFVIAVPIAWYAMNRWLADFAYRIEMGAGIFLLAGGVALFIALATVSWQSVRAALANPVDSLRSE